MSIGIGNVQGHLAVFQYYLEMAILMAQTIQEERFRWVHPIISKEIRLADAAKVCPYSKRSLERWAAAYQHGGYDALVPRSTQPRTAPHETPIRIKERVIARRMATKLCAQKLHWQLKKEHLVVPVRTIGKIIKREGLTRRYRIRKMKVSYVKVPLQPGELIEIDVKYVPESLNNRHYFQYTAIDCASRWRYLKIYDEQSSYHSILFLGNVQKHFPHRIRSIKTDNGSIFTNYYCGTNKRSDATVKTIHPFDEYCQNAGIIHYLIDPGKPAQNGIVERSHREDQEKFYERHLFVSVTDLKRKLRVWNTYYNNLEHCGLGGKSPNEYLAEIISN